MFDGQISFLSVVPSVAAHDSDTRVTRLTKRHEVALLIAATFRERQDMVHLFSRRQLALLLALLTKRMSFDVAITDSFPCPAVALVGRRVAFVLVVLFVHDLLMLGAVLLTLSEPTAAGVGAWTLGFVGHPFPSFRAYEKPPGISPWWLGSLFSFSHYHYTTIPHDINSHWLSTFEIAWFLSRNVCCTL